MLMLILLQECFIPLLSYVGNVALCTQTLGHLLLRARETSISAVELGSDFYISASIASSVSLNQCSFLQGKNFLAFPLCP